MFARERRPGAATAPAVAADSPPRGAAGALPDLEVTMSNRIANTGEEWADLPKFDPRSTRRRKRPLLLGYTRRYIERHSDELGRPHPRIKKTIQTRLDARVIKGRTHWVRQASLASLREFDKALSEHSGDGGLTKYEVAAVAGIKPGTVDHRVRK